MTEQLALDKCIASSMMASASTEHAEQGLPTGPVTSDASLLHLENSENENPLIGTDMTEDLLKQIQEMQAFSAYPGILPEAHTVIPEPGFCIKTKNVDKKEKVFVNVCTSAEIPAPQDIMEEELVRILDSDEPNYRVPLSISEGHAEIDKGGQGCTAYDVLINTEFFKKVEESNLFKGFLMSVIFEGLGNKYNISLERNWVQLKNKKCWGTLVHHNIRTKSKPRIHEMETMNDATQELDALERPKTQLITQIDSCEELSSVAPQPIYTILRDPPEDHPEFLAVEIKLPGVKTSKTLSLDLGEDRLLLNAHPSLYHLDIYLPFNCDPEESGAQFNKDSKVLTLTLSVLPNAT